MLISNIIKIIIKEISHLYAYLEIRNFIIRKCEYSLKDIGVINFIEFFCLLLLKVSALKPEKKLQVKKDSYLRKYFF